MELNKTIELMNSIDFKDRVKAEYYQLKIRHEGLARMLEKYKEGTLEFEPNCDYKRYSIDEAYCLIETLEGTMRGDGGDYIIKGLKGELYPCKPDVFEKKYEEAK